MHEISTSILIKGPHRRSALFERLQDIEAFPRLMGGLMKAQMLRRDGERGLSKWSIEVHGCPVGWVQEDHFDAPHLLYRFDGREGDFDFLTGTWAVRPEGQGSRLAFDTRWDLGLPVIDDLLGRAVEARLEKAASRLQETLRAELERRPFIDDRHGARRPVQMRAGIRGEGLRGLGRILDLSPTGARLLVGAPLLSAGERFILMPGEEPMPARLWARVAWAGADGVVGVSFEEPLREGPLIALAR